MHNSNRTHFVPRADNNTDKYEFVAVPRKSYSESGNEKLQESNDRQLYKFFSNSAPHEHECNNMFPRTNQFESRRVSTLNDSNQQCSHCGSQTPILCCSCFDRRNLITNIDVCNNCRRAWVQSWYYNQDSSSCDDYVDNRPWRPRDVSRHIKRPQILEITYQDHDRQHPISSTYNADGVHLTHSDSRSYKPDVNLNSINSHERNDNNSSTKNVGEPELHSPRDKLSISKDDEINELKRKNNILIAKYAQNYGSLRKRQHTPSEIETKRRDADDSFPLPLMREHLTAVEPRVSNPEKIRQAVSKLEYKWEVR